MSMLTAPPAVSRGDLLSLTPNDVKALSKSEKLALLRDIACQQQRCPALILQLSTDLLKNGGNLGDDVYTIHEQSLIASLDCGNVDLALEHHTKLSKKFGKKAIRVRKLAGLIQEAAERYDAAVTTYTNILHDAPGDAYVVKRLAAMKKGAGDYHGAIEIFEVYQHYKDEEGKAVKFMELHSMDVGALRELAALYLRVWNLEKVLHYTEEVILVEPHLYLNHTRHAEVCYAMGKTEQAAISYAHALRLNDGSNSARSMYGLWLVTNELKKSLTSSKKKHNDSDMTVDNVNDLNQWAVTKLRTLYTGSPVAAALDLVLNKQA